MLPHKEIARDRQGLSFRYSIVFSCGDVKSRAGQPCANAAFGRRSASASASRSTSSSVL
jgi:hypothetical protein